MKHRIATLSAAAVLLAGGVTAASTASARDFFSVSIGVPGFAVGYGNVPYRGYYAPPVAYTPAPVYYGAPAFYAPAPVVYGPRFVYGRPLYRPYYYAHWHR
jgi:hypothetical protein